jgi:hypothetical protein
MPLTLNIFYIMKMNQKKDSMVKTKKQHYVPQFYLKRWGDKDEKSFPIKINNHTPPSLEIIKNKSNVINFCHENYFYSEENAELVEQMFGEVEQKMSIEIPKLEYKILNNQQITSEDKYLLSYYMIIQYFRSKKYIDQSKKMTEDLMKWVNKTFVREIVKKPEVIKSLEMRNMTKEDMIKFVDEGNYSVVTSTESHLRILKEAQGFTNLLSAKYWEVFISRDGDFITTDSPLLDLPTGTGMWDNDYLSREQRFILSPKILIICKNPNDLNSKNFKRKDITSKKDFIHAYNATNLMNSVKFGFHSDEKVLGKVIVMVDYIFKTTIANKNDNI